MTIACNHAAVGAAGVDSYSIAAVAELSETLAPLQFQLTTLKQRLCNETAKFEQGESAHIHARSTAVSLKRRALCYY